MRKKPLQLLRLAKIIGRRGAFLLFLAIIFINGATSFQDQDPALLRRLYPIFIYLPPSIWIIGWAITALFCVIAAWWAQLELYAFGLAQLMFTTWAGNFAWAWIEHSPLKRPWAGMLLYISFAGILMLVAGWRENTPGSRKFHGRD